MSVLTVHPEDQPQQSEVFSGFDSIAGKLQGIGVQLERWRADRDLVADADQAAVVTAYRDSIDRLMQAYGFQSVDVISVRPDHPDKVALRNKFLAEHTHDDFEARFFVDGQGLFYVHPDDKVYLVLCERGDLINVPAHTRHWFVWGRTPTSRLFALFTTPEGWVAHFTGSDIARRFPKLEQFVAEYREAGGRFLSKDYWHIGLAPGEILFLSDIKAEVDAARSAGMKTIWLVREGEVISDGEHLQARNFDDVTFNL